jgi:hypothetical protein
LLPKQQDEPLKVIDNINISWNLNNDIQYLGSKLAIDTFITKTAPSVQPFSIVTFNDYIIFHNGNQTFSLDTRYKTLWTFSEILLDSTRNQQPINMSPPTLYATSRWILSFRIESNDIFIDCFDPYSFIWLNTITSIISTTPTDNIQVIPVVSSATIETDSLVIIVAGTQGTTNNNHAETTNIFWKLDISTTLSTNFTLTKLNPIIHQSDVVLYNGTTTDLNRGGSVVVTPLDDEMTLFYGGAKQLQFFNTTSLTFSLNPQWLNTTIVNSTTTAQPEESNSNHHYLAIILGSVFGSLFFIIIVIILLFWYCRRKRRNKNQNNKVLLRPKNIKNEKLKPSLSSSSSKKNWLLLLLLGKKPKREGMIIYFFFLYFYIFIHLLSINRRTTSSD